VPGYRGWITIRVRRIAARPSRLGLVLVQLDDKRELMLYLLRRRDGSVTLNPAAASWRPTARSAFSRATRSRSTFSVRWTSPHTGANYPSGWRIRVPSAGLDVSFVPTVLDQELAGTRVAAFPTGRAR